jgi:cation diffusion facilitator CzcD-associated flavoprotein CzcO
VVIVGAGFSGIGMAIALKREGRDDFVILEKTAEVGGTWLVNDYPGCACDIPSHLYSFSFEPNPDWTRLYAPQAEILAYLRRCTQKFDLLPHLRFQTELKAARFDEQAGLWRLWTRKGEELAARSLILGVGPLSRPAYPDYPGLQRFQGKTFHSAKWDHTYPLEGKRVAVVGTGASAIQFVPQIAPKVDHLLLLQRTPPWVLPKRDAPIPPWVQRLLRTLPSLERLFRVLLYWLLEARGVGFSLFPTVNKVAIRMGLAQLQRQIRDPALRAKLTPDYLPGCKRILLANDYYPVLERPNVTLLSTTIREVTEDGFIAADGSEHRVDALIFGTGFRVTDPLGDLQILGRGGLDLGAAWKDGMQAYLGTTLADFPNLFFLLGPNTGLGHNSMVFMIEAQVHYIQRMLETLHAGGWAYATLKPAAQDAFNGDLAPRLQRSVWASGCKSWYLDARGNNPTAWPGTTLEFWRRTRRVEVMDYDFFRAEPSTGALKAAS